MPVIITSGNKAFPDPIQDWGIQKGPSLMDFQEKNKMRMLFLDDRTKRVESARRQYGEKWDLAIVSNVKECLRKMSEEDWDEVHLDHDLNGEDFQDPHDPMAGMAVVYYIQKCGWPANKRKPIFRIHSSNVFAAYLMVKTLQGIGFYAFWERFQYLEAS